MNLEVIQQEYQNKILQLKLELKKLQNQHVFLAIARLISVFLVLYFIYFLLNKANKFWIGALVSAFIFVLLKNLQQKVSQKKDLIVQKISINTNEINAIQHHQNPMDNGEVFLDKAHPYALDLDIFGEQSLFHLINRCGTYIGQQKLASSLTQALPPSEINLHQDAVKELSPMLDFRQDVLAITKGIENERKAYEFLKNWANSPQQKVYQWQIYLPFVFSFSLVLLIIFSLVNDNVWWGRLAFLNFMINLFYFVFWIKKITAEIGKSDKISNILQSYALVIDSVISQDFKSNYLKQIQSNLGNQSGAAQKIKQLAKLFEGLESIQNVVAAILFNGSVLHHIRKYNLLIQWKNNNLSNLVEGLNWIGELEKLNSFSNFYYNHPHYNFPTINNQNQILWEGLGHPLMRGKGVANSINFNPFSLVILTGSNMSGKSTFLRAVGVNSVLAYAGAPVFAKSANVCVLPILASMRLTDSINENTSYFFAEIKKLKSIVDVAQNQSALILLDEILRGTNSVDKQQGTIAFIKKIKMFNAKVIIATHDLEVCDLAKKYPVDIQNYCFESQVIDNELFFDYQLRPGICANKNASFLLQKHGVI